MDRQMHLEDGIALAIAASNTLDACQTPQKLSLVIFYNIPPGNRVAYCRNAGADTRQMYCKYAQNITSENTSAATPP